MNPATIYRVDFGSSSSTSSGGGLIRRAEARPIYQDDDSGVIALDRPGQSLAERISSLATAMVAEERAARVKRADEPFGPLYISRIGPDVINSAAVEDLNRFASIHDLSSELAFDD